MIYFYNIFFIFYFKISNILRNILTGGNRIFSCRNIMEANFPEDKPFSFIQIGANDGISFDFLYEFVTKRNSRGIVVEPIKEYFDELVYNYREYPEIIKVNKAIYPSGNKITLNRISPHSYGKYPDWVKGIASVNPDQHIKLGISDEDITQEVVNVDNLMNIVNANYYCKINNFFQIDTEGFDHEIIKMLDFKSFKPDIIKYEYVHLANKDHIMAHKLLKKNKYFLFKEDGDIICINLRKIRLVR